MPLLRLDTLRLRLRTWSREDLDAILQMDLDPEVHRFSEMRVGHFEPDRSVLRKAIRRQILSEQPRSFWVIEWRSRPGFLGLIGFSPGQLERNALSFRLVRSAWGQGIATEAARAVLDHGFGALNLPLIVAFAHKQNRRSHRVLSKIGMRLDGIAVLQQRSILNVPKAIRPIGSFLNVDSSRGDMYLSYGLYRQNYVSNGDAA